MAFTSLGSILGPLTPEQIQARYKSGRGQGEFDKYSPWLKVTEVKSHGQSFVENSWLFDRPAHLLSGIERSNFLASQRLAGVLDAREQFPLWPLEETQAIAASAAFGVSHPRVPGSSHDSLMTTDLVLTTNWPGERLVPIHVKPAAELAKPRHQEKLGIEVEYWRRRGWNLRVVTEQELPRALAKNLSSLAGYRVLDLTMLEGIPLERVVSALALEIKRHPLMAANRLCSDLDVALGIDTGACKAVFWHLIAIGRWRTDLSKLMSPSCPFGLLTAP